MSSLLPSQGGSTVAGGGGGSSSSTSSSSSGGAVNGGPGGPQSPNPSALQFVPNLFGGCSRVLEKGEIYTHLYVKGVFRNDVSVAVAPDCRHGGGIGVRMQRPHSNGGQNAKGQCTVWCQNMLKHSRWPKFAELFTVVPLITMSWFWDIKHQT